MRSTDGRGEALLYALGLFAFAPLLAHTAYLQEPRPRISVDLIASLQDLKERLPARSVIAHTWGHAYLVTAVTGAATFNDGELLDPVVEQLLDRGLASDDPRQLYSILAFLAARGRAGVDRALDDVQGYPALLERIATDSAIAPDPLYLLLTAKMAREFSHYFRKAHWDFTNARGPREGYDFRSCRPLPDHRLRCEKEARRPLIVDPKEGTINGAHAVKKLLRIRGGALVEEIDYPIEPGLYLQLIEESSAEPWELQILKQIVYETNFNQMFVLGRHDAALFRPIHDDFPVARAYELIHSDPSIR